MKEYSRIYLFLNILITVSFLLPSCNNHNAAPKSITIKSSSKKVDNDSYISDSITTNFLKDTLNYTTEKIDRELSHIYDSLSVDCYGGSAEKFLPLFEKQLKRHLKSKLTYNHTLSRLSKRIKIIRTNGINFYSFDDMMGGTMRYDKTYIQYMTPNRVIHVQELEDEGFVSEAYPFNLDGSSYILVISYSQGSTICLSTNLRVYSIKDQVKTTGIFFPHDNFEIHNQYLKKGESMNGVLTAGNVFRIYKNGQSAEWDMDHLHFDSKTNTISYKEFAFGKNDSICDTGKRIEWRLKRR